MRLTTANINQIGNIVRMSKAAFESDISVGGKCGDYPPEYDSMEWHLEMAEKGHLYQAMVGDLIIGAAILFYNEESKNLYVGRIFVDTLYHGKGYGIDLMKCVENVYTDVNEIFLNTPLWNIRTNSFYKKLGYIEVKKEDGFCFYQKKIER